jgi:thiol-disulfide isomerase/thioredoxin
MGVSVTLLMVVGIAYFHGEDRAKKAASDSLKVEVLKSQNSEQVGQSVLFKDIIQGEFTLINFWASWCTVCEKDLVQLAAINEQLGEHFNKVGVVTMDLKSDLFLSGKLDRQSTAQYLDEEGLLAERYRVRGLPTTILVDQNNNPILRQDGAIDAEFRKQLAARFSK